MKKILFVCHGNIFRSPMAEFVMKDLLRKAGRAEGFFIASAGTSAEELGNPVYPPAQKILKEHGLDPAGKYARRLQRDDYDHYDYFVAMDGANVKNMQRLWNGDPDRKILRLMDLTNRPGDIADPWYSHNYIETWTDVTEGCAALLSWLDAQKA